jgi:SAM-dependent methyltransferase
MTHGMQPLTPDDPAYAGQKHYTRSFLRIYDPLVLGLFGNLVWRCPTRRLVEHYRTHMSSSHLDVGPGTGYFLARAAPPAGTRLTLLDPNVDVLAHASRRLARLAPTTVQADVLKPLPIRERFASVALNYVIHCLPGPMEARVPAIRNVAAVLDAEGILFGATVLGTPNCILASPGWPCARTTDAASSTTSRTRRRGFDAPSRRRSATSRSRSPAQSRSSLPRTPR